MHKRLLPWYDTFYKQNMLHSQCDLAVNEHIKPGVEVKPGATGLCRQIPLRPDALPGVNEAPIITELE